MIIFIKKINGSTDKHMAELDRGQDRYHYSVLRLSSHCSVTGECYFSAWHCWRWRWQSSNWQDECQSLSTFERAIGGVLGLSTVTQRVFRSCGWQGMLCLNLLANLPNQAAFVGMTRGMSAVLVHLPSWRPKGGLNSDPAVGVAVAGAGG